MKGFTLVEFSVTIFILTLLFGIVFNFNALNKDSLYLKSFARKLNNAFGIAQFLAQHTKTYQDQNICAYGVYFPDDKSYQTLAFSSSTLTCDYLIQNNLNNFVNNNLLPSSKKYLHSNLEIRNVPLNELVLNDNLENGNFIFSENQNCVSSSDLRPPLLFLFVYSYTDMYFLYREINGRWQRSLEPAVYLCLKRKNEIIKIRINKIGQIYLID